MNPHTLLVTGGAGFIGSNFVHYWLRSRTDTRVIVLDALTYAGNPENLRPWRADGRFRFVHGDIRDEALLVQLFREEQVDTVVHFAAETHVDRSIVGPDPFLATNVIGTHSLLKIAKARWIDGGGTVRPHRFHHVSTDEVYGSLALGDSAFTEDSPYKPSSPYAASKAASDHLVRAYHRTYGLNITISNCSNNYGPYHYPEKLVPLLIVNALEGRTLPIYGDGSNIRDWLYVMDHCVGLALVLERGVAGHTYNIGGGFELSNLQVAKMICAGIDAIFAADRSLSGRFPNCPASRDKRTECLVRFVDDRPGHDLRYAVDASKTRRELGFVPRYTPPAGIKETIRWYIDNESWWRTLVNEDYRKWIAEQYG